MGGGVTRTSLDRIKQARALWNGDRAFLVRGEISLYLSEHALVDGRTPAHLVPGKIVVYYIIKGA
jgi:hypothetical protein